MMANKHLFCFGFGFSAQALRALLPDGWQVSATTRDPDKAKKFATENIKAVLFDGCHFPNSVFDGVTHILVSAPPSKMGDPILQTCALQLKKYAPQVDWVGYLSTTSVYGDHQGAWIDEDTPLLEGGGRVGMRGQRRSDAEATWAKTGLPVHYFRLAGIYGPGRNALSALVRGTARRINKPGQVFSRIHVADIAQILLASMLYPNPGRAYSICDDEPAPPQDVVAFAAELLGMDAPPLIDFDEAELSPLSPLSLMAQSFYDDNKRIRNDRIKTELGIRLIYPDYKIGLTALYKASDY